MFYGRDYPTSWEKVLGIRLHSRRPSLSQDAINFIKRLLHPKPENRPSAADALNDDWLKKSADWLGKTPEAKTAAREASAAEDAKAKKAAKAANVEEQPGRRIEELSVFSAMGPLVPGEGSIGR